MANLDQLSFLRVGASTWNEWRMKNPSAEPNLREADLSDAMLNGVDLSGVDLSDSKLVKTSLVGADLTDAKLNRARMTHANLSKANLERASLRGADLWRTNLAETNLAGADLIGVTFNNVDLQRSHLGFAQFGKTIFINTDLRDAVGLDNTTHFLPSTIDLDTIFISKGQIPLTFLRNIGVAEDLARYIVTTKGTPFEFLSCFISYSTKNQDFADRLYADLQNNNVRCWLATEDLKIGDKFRTRIEESIRIHDKLLLVLSETSVASPWVESEVESAMERERKENRLILFPVMLDNAVMDTNVAWAADIRRTRHIGDFRDWKNHDSYKKSLDRLLRDLKAENANDKR